MATTAAPGKEPNGASADGATWGRHGGDKKDPDLERISGMSFLIVDDSRFARTTIKNVLLALGIRRVIEAEDAPQALTILEKQGADVVIVDFEMPGMSGAEFTWRLRRSKNEALQQIPVVMVSTHADEGHIRTAINAGVNEFLPKPFSQSGLYQRVRRSVVTPKPFIISEGYVGPDRRLKDRDGAEKASPGGLPPVVLFDCTGAEPKRIETGAQAAAKSAPLPVQAAPAKPKFSVLSEGGDVAESVNEKLKD
ncbi:MAG: response regulator [Alphaproteobacteria bacterium]|nr:response regulator [Alphaproteobacteria bacterium]